MYKSKESTGKKLSGQVKGYILLLLLVIISWGIFKIITPDNFGSPKIFSVISKHHFLLQSVQ